LRPRLRRQGKLLRHDDEQVTKTCSAQLHSRSQAARVASAWQRRCERCSGQGLTRLRWNWRPHAIFLCSRSRHDMRGLPGSGRGWPTPSRRRATLVKLESNVRAWSTKLECLSSTPRRRGWPSWARGSAGKSNRNFMAHLSIRTHHKPSNCIGPGPGRRLAMNRATSDIVRAKGTAHAVPLMQLRLEGASAWPAATNRGNRYRKRTASLSSETVARNEASLRSVSLHFSPLARGTQDNFPRRVSVLQHSGTVSEVDFLCQRRMQTFCEILTPSRLAGRAT
jgi:hypothetical protein